MSRTKVVIGLDEATFRQLAELAQREERVVDQQAAYFIKRALRELQSGRPEPGKEQPAEEVRQ